MEPNKSQIGDNTNETFMSISYIIDKIRKNGYSSLTLDERTFYRDNYKNVVKVEDDGTYSAELPPVTIKNNPVKDAVYRGGKFPQLVADTMYTFASTPSATIGETMNLLHGKMPNYANVTRYETQQFPAQQLGIKNPYLSVLVNTATDPVAIYGLGKNIVQGGIKALDAFNMANRTIEGTTMSASRNAARNALIKNTAKDVARAGAKHIGQSVKKTYLPSVNKPLEVMDVGLNLSHNLPTNNPLQYIVPQMRTGNKLATTDVNRKLGGKINKRKQLKLFNMTNKYEYGGRIGDESFIGRTSNIGPFRGIDYKRKKKNKISVSTMQPKWALNNGAIPSYHNSGLQVKAKMGGNIKKYQYAGTANSARGNAGYSSEGKQSVTNINPQFSGGYGNTAVTFNPNLRVTGNKVTDKRLNAGLIHSRANFDVNSNYTNDNNKRLFNNNIEYNNGVFNAGVNSTIGTNQKPVYGVNSGLKFNGIDAQGGFKYGDDKRESSAALNVNGYRGSGNVLYNRVYDEKTGDATTNVGAVYTGRKGLTAGANYSNGVAGQSASGNLGYKGNNGYIQANATFNPNNTNTNMEGQYSNQGTTKSGKQWHVGVKGGMNFKNKMGGKILAQSGVTIPDSTYYAKAESTSTPLYKNNKVNALKLAEKRRREEEAERLNQGTITQGTYNPSQPTHMESVKNRLDNTDLAASTLHIPQYAATETYNHFVNKQPFNWGHLKPGAHGITPSDLMHIQNPYGRLAADLILDPLNFGPGILGHTLTGIKQIKNLGKAVEIANATAKLGDAANATNKAINVGNVGYNIAKGFAKDAAHMGEHIITHPIHGPAAMQRSFDYTINKDSTKKVADGDVGIKHHKLGGIIKKKRNIKWAGQ